jgi:hypothetical protein
LARGEQFCWGWIELRRLHPDLEIDWLAQHPVTKVLEAHMIEQIARSPRVRDRAVFVGDPDDIVPERFGPELPDIRGWRPDAGESVCTRLRLGDPLGYSRREPLAGNDDRQREGL